MTLGQEQLVITDDVDPVVVARHKARYHLVAFFCRPGMKVIDFPCGSGYGSEILSGQGVTYFGLDSNEEALIYARKNYDNCFNCADLTTWSGAWVGAYNYFDIIACIEGLEHIDKDAQVRLIDEFYQELKPGGRLIISSPESTTGVSGPNPKNPHHKHELTRKDFIELLYRNRDWGWQIITLREVLDDGLEHNCFYAICQK